MREDFIDFDDDELRAANAWHGGQGSMLYAIASTGALSRGTIRPRHRDGTPMTDEEWMDDLAERLSAEASMAARDAERQAMDADTTEEAVELRDEQDALERIAIKADDYVASGKRTR